MIHTIKIPIKGISIDARLITCRRWPTPRIGVYIEVPFHKITHPELMMKWCKYSFNKELRSVMRTDLYGTHFNVYMSKNGMSDFDLTSVKDAWTYKSFIAEFKCPASKVANLIAISIRCLMRVPTKSDLAYPDFKGLDIEYDDLKVYANKLMNAKLNIAFIASKKSDYELQYKSWGEAIVEKLKRYVNVEKNQKAVDTKRGEPTLNENLPPPEVVEKQIIEIDIGKFRSPYSLLVLNQILDTHLYPSGKTVSYKVEFPYEFKTASAFMKNLPGIQRIIRGYIEIGEHKKQNAAKASLDEKEAIEAMVIVAVATHLPLDYAFSLSKEKQLPDAIVIHRDLSQVV